LNTDGTLASLGLPRVNAATLGGRERELWVGRWWHSHEAASSQLGRVGLQGFRLLLPPRSVVPSLSVVPIRPMPPRPFRQLEVVRAATFSRMRTVRLTLCSTLRRRPVRAPRSGRPGFRRPRACPTSLSERFAWLGQDCVTDDIAQHLCPALLPRGSARIGPQQTRPTPLGARLRLARPGLGNSMPGPTTRLERSSLHASSPPPRHDTRL